jgi:hypothetical protein
MYEVVLVQRILGTRHPAQSLPSKKAQIHGGIVAQVVAAWRLPAGEVAESHGSRDHADLDRVLLLAFPPEGGSDNVP